MEAAAAQLFVELEDMETAVHQKQADLETFTPKLEQLRPEGSGLDALYQRRDAIQAELATVRTNDNGTVTTSISDDAGLQEELRLINQQITEGEANYRTNIANLEEDIAWFLAEIDRLRNALVNGEGELQEKRRIISDIQEKLGVLNTNGVQTDVPATDADGTVLTPLAPVQ